MYVLSLNRILLNIGWKRCAESCLFWLRGLPKERAVKGHLCAWLTHSQNGVYGKLEIEQRGTGPTQSTAVRLGACKCPISKSKSRIMGETLKLVYVQIFFTKWLYILYSGIYPLMNSKKFSNSKKKQWDPHLHADTYPLWLHTSKMQEEQNTAVHILHTEICNFSPSLTHSSWHSVPHVVPHIPLAPVGERLEGRQSAGIRLFPLQLHAHHLRGTPSGCRSIWGRLKAAKCKNSPHPGKGVETGAGTATEGDYPHTQAGGPRASTEGLRFKYTYGLGYISQKENQTLRIENLIFKKNNSPDHGLCSAILLNKKLSDQHTSICYYCGHLESEFISRSFSLPPPDYLTLQ